ncbi:unnamed protein product [Polarella glacialis]|uniref:Uncharacterized protein n=1 Tax=Polarella glacialis TaxID=89957 RepID=A0A813JPL0_POLGL|nr:unnamed protein product [Polarella glacialis]CAE8682499.1 unnamed protein product [Polarella glacialis]
MSRRSVSTMALPPSSYAEPKGAFWKGTREHDRFPPVYREQEEIVEEYMANKSMSPSRHVQALQKSAGLLELHYDTMRKRAQDRQSRPDFEQKPSMNRSFAACPGYQGLIPGKISNNIVGCSWMDGSKIAEETRGQHLGSPMSGVTYTIGKKSTIRSASLTSLHCDSPTSMLSRTGGSAVSPHNIRARDMQPASLSDDGDIFG